MRTLGHLDEGTDVVTSYSFKIVRRPNDRFSWVFVEVRGDRRRVLARADRDYRYKERAEKAIGVIRKKAWGAEFLDATGATDDFDLPARGFEIAPYVVPLVIGQPRARHTRANGHRRRPGSRTTPTGQPDHLEAEDTALAGVSSAGPARRDSSDDAGALEKAAPAPPKKTVPAPPKKTPSAPPKKTPPAASATKATRRGAAKTASRGRPAAGSGGTR
jgi:hypothetical protein